LTPRAFDTVAKVRLVLPWEKVKVRVVPARKRSLFLSLLSPFRSMVGSSRRFSQIKPVCFFVNLAGRCAEREEGFLNPAVQSSHLARRAGPFFKPRCESSANPGPAPPFVPKRPANAPGAESRLHQITVRDANGQILVLVSVEVTPLTAPSRSDLPFLDRP